MLVTSFDTETTGLDFAHGTRPFMCMISEWRIDDKFHPISEMKTEVYRWPVNPLNREVSIDRDELQEIVDKLTSARCLVAHNAKYDCHSIKYAARDLGIPCEWNWNAIHDTVCSAHLLESGKTRNLTDQVLRWLKVDVAPFEKKIKLATEKARALCRSKSFIEEFGTWDISRAKHPNMPSSTEDGWKGDMWLPYEIVRKVLQGEMDPNRLPEFNGWKYNKRVQHRVEDHPFITAIDDYAAADSETTLALYCAHQSALKTRELNSIYENRRTTIRLSYHLESRGVTLNKARLEKQTEDYEQAALKAQERCRALSGVEELKLPASGANKALRSVLFDEQHLNLPVVNTTKTGAASCDADTIKAWLELLPERSKAHQFVKAISDYRKFRTAISYMQAYQRFWVPERSAGKDWCRIHPSLNPHGTRTLRWSSSNPNEQNISKKEGANLRYCFGPLPGRGWASKDYENLELRIPAYASGESSIIGLFERPDEPPYYGSNHLLNFEAVYPDLWEVALKNVRYDKTKVADWIKNTWKSTWYQGVKNGGFAVQYGSVDTDDPTRLSTADRAFMRKGCHALLQSKFGALNELNLECIEQAETFGYVETLKNLSVDGSKGYPLEIGTNDWGKIKPTQPLNTRVQGTACWIISEAMDRVERYYDKVNRKLGYTGIEGFYITMQVHDELVTDFPLNSPYEEVLAKARKIMEDVGIDFNVPLKVGLTMHLDNWHTGVDVPS